MEALPIVGDEIIHLDKNTFMWVQLTHFVLPSGDDRSVIEALIASPGYAHDYASPFAGDQQPDLSYGSVHGRWWLSAIHSDRFGAVPPDVAEQLIRDWADGQEWADPDYRQPLDVLQRLNPIYALLRTGRLYHLNNPSVHEEHDYGSVTGGMGFHEFVVIDPDHAQVHVVVASDD